MIIWFSEHGRDPARLVDNPEKYRFRRVKNRGELVEQIMADEPTACILLVTDSLGSGIVSLADSLKRFYPAVPVGLLVPGQLLNKVRELGYPAVDSGGETLEQFLDSILKSQLTAERREHPRFEWPLTGRLVENGVLSDPFRVLSVSAGGAFFESRTVLPEPPAEIVVEISFADFKLLTDCRVLGRRSATETMPPGFAVEFLELSPQSIRMIDAIIWDELMHCVLKPESAVHQLSLGYD